ncbi:hypothetical protein P7K49_009051 [Saguinus oedipus]|uniref:Uncharacterized protein n=1 Tax=Saguinus oedipus TaxID=9490 RepID=A0ABQ9VZG1_SAGOE|nr:hypothetical protein P7K49_009051 [Saguinus oedipus]
MGMYLSFLWLQSPVFPSHGLNKYEASPTVSAASTNIILQDTSQGIWGREDFFPTKSLSQDGIPTRRTCSTTLMNVPLASSCTVMHSEEQRGTAGAGRRLSLAVDTGPGAPCICCAFSEELLICSGEDFTFR